MSNLISIAYTFMGVCLFFTLMYLLMAQRKRSKRMRRSCYYSRQKPIGPCSRNNLFLMIFCLGVPSLVFSLVGAFLLTDANWQTSIFDRPKMSCWPLVLSATAGGMLGGLIWARLDCWLARRQHAKKTEFEAGE